jgi:hypothetical protein
VARRASTRGRASDEREGILRLVATVTLVIGLSSSGAASGPSDSTLSRALAATSVAAPVYLERGTAESGRGVALATAAGRLESEWFLRGLSARSEHCPSAHQAVRFYERRLNEWRTKMGAGAGTPVAARRAETQDSCPRYLAHVLQRKAHAARRAYGRWVEYHWHWKAWLPAKWQRIAICETGLNWRHSNSSYEGAFGFALQSWDSFVGSADPKAGPYPANAYLATPRQQYEVALAIYRRYGLSGWGCRNA